MVACPLYNLNDWEKWYWTQLCLIQYIFTSFRKLFIGLVTIQYLFTMDNELMHSYLTSANTHFAYNTRSNLWAYYVWALRTMCDPCSEPHEWLLAILASWVTNASTAITSKNTRVQPWGTLNHDSYTVKELFFNGTIRPIMNNLTVYYKMENIIKWLQTWKLEKCMPKQCVLQQYILRPASKG